MIYECLIFLVVVLVLYVPVPWSIGRILKKLQKQKAVSQNQLYLTFDDGPGSRLTPRILEILNENNIKATFFLLGRNIAGREHIVQALLDQGHTIASHGFSHLHAWKTAPWKTVADIRISQTLISEKVLEKRTPYAYRPPYGKLDLVTLVFLFFIKVPLAFWSVDCRDTWPENTRNAHYAAEKIRRDGGGIVLFHDFDRSTPEIDNFVIDSLNSVIAAGKQMNLEFVTIESLFS